jgi:hypothetical protein
LLGDSEGATLLGGISTGVFWYKGDEVGVWEGLAGIADGVANGKSKLGKFQREWLRESDQNKTAPIPTKATKMAINSSKPREFV